MDNYALELQYLKIISIRNEAFLKITYIHQHFNLPNEGGGGRPYEFARRMAADGHEVTIICGGARELKTEVNGVKISRLAIPYRNAMTSRERLWSFARFMIAASGAVARTDADIIYASSTPLTVAVPAIIGKFIRRVPMVFEVRDLWPSVPIKLGYLNNRFAVWLAYTLERTAYHCADSVVALSPGMRDGILQVNPDKDVAVIPNACDFDLFSGEKVNYREFREAQGWRDDETIVVYAGSFGPIYELDWVTHLASKVKHSGIRFVLIGEGKCSGPLRELSIELGLDPNKIFLGKRPRTEVASFIAASDIVLSSVGNEPCLESASINKIFDGMAASRPVLSNHGGWLTEMLIKEKAGWQLNREVDAAADQLRAIAKDKKALEAAGKNSATLGKNYFDRNDLYRKLIGVLQAAVEAPR